MPPPPVKMEDDMLGTPEDIKSHTFYEYNQCIDNTTFGGVGGIQFDGHKNLNYKFYNFKQEFKPLQKSEGGLEVTPVVEEHVPKVEQIKAKPLRKIELTYNHKQLLEILTTSALFWDRNKMANIEQSLMDDYIEKVNNSWRTKCEGGKGPNWSKCRIYPVQNFEV